MSVNTITVSFVHERETKNAHRFAEVDNKGKTLDVSDAIVGTLYLKKSAIGEKAPAKLRITIEAETAAKGKPAASKAAPAKTETAKPAAKADAKKPVAVKKTSSKAA